MHRKILLLSLVVMALNGCASYFEVQVSAIADTEYNAETSRYVLLNGNVEDGENDLFFREFSAYFIPILAKKGYQRVENAEAADLEIFLRYTVSEGRTGITTFAHPMYETVGGNTINIIETTTDGSGGTTTTRSTVHIPLQTVYVGSSVESRSYTLYTSSAALEAYTIKPSGKILWKTLMNSTSESNDLRAIMPAMATAAEPYLTKNSGKSKTVRIKHDDPKLLNTIKQASQ